MYEDLGPYSTRTQALQVGGAAYSGLSATLTTPLQSDEGKQSAAEGGETLASSNNLPLVVFSPGFLVASSAYDSYHQQLASWG